MINLAQASDGGTWFFPALAIAIGLVALAAWVTHLIWFFRSFGLFRAIRSFGKDNVVLSIVRKNWLSCFLGVIGFSVPIVGIMHGFAIWAGAGARVGDSARIASAGQAGERKMQWWIKALIFSVIWVGVVGAVGSFHTDVFLAGQITPAQEKAIVEAYGDVAAFGLSVVWGICFLFFVLRRTSA